MKYFLILLISFVTSCAGYQYQKLDNPFSQYGVTSIAIPMFYNHSNFNNVAPQFTTELHKVLSGFKGLKVINGTNKSDAVLIGVISSPASRKDSRFATTSRAVKGVTPGNVGSRDDFYVAGTNSLRMSLTIMVIKQPTPEEIRILQSDLGKNQVVSSKVLFTETIPVTGSYSKVIFDGTAGQVVHTQNRGIESKNIKTMATTAASTFRNMILYAF